MHLTFSAFAEVVALFVWLTSPVFAATSVCFEEPRLLSLFTTRVTTRSALGLERKDLAAPII